MAISNVGPFYPGNRLFGTDREFGVDVYTLHNVCEFINDVLLKMVEDDYAGHLCLRCFGKLPILCP